MPMHRVNDLQALAWRMAAATRNGAALLMTIDPRRCGPRSGAADRCSASLRLAAGPLAPSRCSFSRPSQASPPQPAAPAAATAAADLRPARASACRASPRAKPPPCSPRRPTRRRRAAPTDGRRPAADRRHVPSAAHLRRRQRRSSGSTPISTASPRCRAISSSSRANGRRLEGTLYIQRPGKMRFEYDPPATTEVIADGTSVAVRDKRWRRRTSTRSARRR